MENKGTRSLNKILKKALTCLVLAGFLFLAPFSLNSAQAAAGVPKIISYQGRLADSNGVLFGGAGTTYYFKFSIWDASANGTKLWPTAAPASVPLNVVNGVFNANVGDVSAGFDALSFNFQDNDTVFLQVEVSSNNTAFETLTPRMQVASSAYAINSGTTPTKTK